MTGKWFKIWFEDKESIIETMVRNMHADLEAGYDLNGYSIRKQMVDIETYKREFDRQMDMFKLMEDAKVNSWCYYDLKKRGVID